MAYNKTDKADASKPRRSGIRRKKKVCVFCGDTTPIDYKDVARLKKYVSERGKILPRRITGRIITTRDPRYNMFERMATAFAVASFVLPFFRKKWYTKTGMLSAVRGE